MSPGQGEIRHVVVEARTRIPGGVAGQASRTVVGVPTDSIVLIIGLRIGMAACAGEFCEIGRVGVTIRTSVPLILVFATVNREIIPVVIESSRNPGGLAVAGSAIF